MKRLSAEGDPLEVLGRVSDFEAFRPPLVAALSYSDGAKGGRPPYDPVVMLKVLVLAAQNNVSNGRMEWLIRDRLNWLRFLGFDLGAATPDANTIRTFRERLTNAGALDTLFADFDRQLRERGYLPQGRADRRRHAGGGAQAEEHRGRADGGEGRQERLRDLGG